MARVQGNFADERFANHQFGNQALHNNGYTSTTSQGKPQALDEGLLTPDQQSMLLFGPNRLTTPTNPYTQGYVTTKVESDVFTVGEYMRKVVLALVTKSDQILTGEIIPWKRFSGDPNVKVDVLEFSDNQLDDVPEKGTIRLLTHRESTTAHTIGRKGIGFQMEGGYAKTARGIQDYGYNMVQIGNSVVTHASRLIIEALLNPGPVTNDWWQRMGTPYNEVTLEQIFNWECALWGILSKTEFGMGQLISRAREVMSNREVEVDTLIVPFNSSEPYRRTHPEELSYSEMGPMGPKRRVAHAWPGPEISGLKIVESPKFSNGTDSPPNDPTVRGRRTHGEMFFMTLESVPDHNKFTTRSLDIKVLDCGRDSVVRISYIEALRHSGLWTHDGDLSHLGVGFFSGFPSLYDYFEATGTLDYMRKCFRHRAVRPTNVRDFIRNSLPAVRGSVTYSRADIGRLKDQLPRDVRLNLQQYTQQSPLADTLFPDILFNVATIRGAADPANQAKTVEIMEWIRVQEAHFRTLGFTADMLGNTAATDSTHVIDPVVMEALPVNADYTSFCHYFYVLHYLYSSLSYPGMAIIAFAGRNTAAVRGDIEGLASNNVPLGATDITHNEAQFQRALRWTKCANLTWNFIKAFWADEIFFPISVILARPHMTWEMGSCVALRRGLQTGATMIGNEDFQVFNNTRKVLEGNFTLHMGAIIYEPKNVLVLHNTVCKAYVAGGGVSMYDPYDPNHVESYNQGNNVADIFCLAVPFGWRPTRQHMDLTGEYPRDLVESHSRQGEFLRHYPTADLYRNIWQWTTRPDRAHLDIEFQDPSAILNTRVWQGTQFNMNRKGEVSRDKIAGTGHWGPYVYGGVVADRTSAGSGRCVRCVYEHESS